MLVLKREVGQKILIGADIVVTVLEIERGRVVLGVDAPRAVLVLRDELAKPAIAACTPAGSL